MEVVESVEKDEYVHHVTYLAMLAIVTTLVADQAFDTRESSLLMQNDSIRPVLAFTYASTYWLSLLSVTTSIAGSLVSMRSRTKPRVYAPTILFFLTLFFWMIHKLILDISQIVEKSYSKNSELVSYILPTILALGLTPCILLSYSDAKIQLPRIRIQ